MNNIEAKYCSNQKRIFVDLVDNNENEENYGKDSNLAEKVDGSIQSSASNYQHSRGNVATDIISINNEIKAIDYIINTLELHLNSLPTTIADDISEVELLTKQLMTGNYNEILTSNENSMNNNNESFNPNNDQQEQQEDEDELIIKDDNESIGWKKISAINFRLTQKNITNETIRKLTIIKEILELRINSANSIEVSVYIYLVLLKYF